MSEQVKMTRWTLADGSFELHEYTEGDEHFPNARVVIDDPSLMEDWLHLRARAEDFQARLRRL